MRYGTSTTPLSIYIYEIFDSMNCGRFGAKMKGLPTLTPTVQGRDAATLRNSVRIKYRRHINLYLFQNELGGWGPSFGFTTSQAAHRAAQVSDFSSLIFTTPTRVLWTFLCCPVTCLNVYYADKCVCSNMLLTFTGHFSHQGEPLHVFTCTTGLQ